MITLMAGKILTGDAGGGAAVQAIQEKYKAVLPGLVEQPENAERK
jgi:hypothetical protein